MRVCRFTLDSTRIVTAGDDGTICFWNLAHRSLVKLVFLFLTHSDDFMHLKTLLRSITAHTETIQALSTSPDSVLVASGCSQGILHIHDIEDGQLLATQDTAHDMGVTATEFSPCSRATSKLFENS